MTDSIIEKITNTDPASKSLDLEAQNIDQLKQLFPDVFREGKVDFEALKAVLGEHVEDNEERYNFTWHGKNKARQIAQTPSTGTLLPCKEESVNWDTTQNLFIEGDNLEALKLLQKSYHKKVKMIYIDPPYNTGNDFIYNDSFSDNISNYLNHTAQVSSDGKVYSANPETTGRYHSNWLNMIYPRLKLARNLLCDDGVIMISIDDSEFSNLKKVCEEVFGEENFVGQFVWKSRQNKDNRNITNASLDHEYILAFGKKIRGAERNMSQYKNPDNDPRGDWSSANMVGLLPEDQRPNCHYDLINPDSDINYGKPKMGWRYDKNTMNQLIKENKIIWPTSIDGRPRRKKFLNELQQEYTGYSSIVGTDVYTRHGTIEIEDLFKFKAFDFPKPTALLKDLLIQGMGEEKSALFMDFFAGSGSSFDALMQINKENNTSHRYIAIQLPESVDKNSPSGLNGFKDIAGISAKRIALADKKYNGSNMVGFKYLKLSDSNINRWEPEFDSLSDILDSSVDSIKSERDSDDVLYEVLLKYGLDLTYPITEHTLAGKIVYDVAFGSLIVCLDDGITRDVVEAIGKLKQELDSETTRVVFKDAGFADDSVKVNAIQMLKQYGVDDVKSI